MKYFFCFLLMLSNLSIVKAFNYKIKIETDKSFEGKKITFRISDPFDFTKEVYFEILGVVKIKNQMGVLNFESEALAVELIVSSEYKSSQKTCYVDTGTSTIIIPNNTNKKYYKNELFALRNTDNEIYALNSKCDSLLNNAGEQGISFNNSKLQNELYNIFFKAKKDQISLIFIRSKVNEHFYKFYSTHIKALLNTISPATKDSKAYKEIESIIQNLEKLKVGQQVPSFKLKNINDSVISETNLLGKNYILFFSATWCGPCKLIIDSLKRIDFKSLNTEIVYITLWSELDDWKKQYNQLPQSWIKLFDYDIKNESKIQKEFNLIGVPLMYAIDPNGKILVNPIEISDYNIALALRYKSKSVNWL